jgi:hypothetical protein
MSYFQKELKIEETEPAWKIWYDALPVDDKAYLTEAYTSMIIKVPMPISWERFLKQNHRIMMRLEKHQKIPGMNALKKAGDVVMMNKKGKKATDILKEIREEKEKVQ